MGAPDLKIVRFIRRHHVMTLATCRGGQPWCANVFYAYIPDHNLFVFTSDVSTRHGREAADNARVSASIVLETRVVGRVQGLQIEGRLELTVPKQACVDANAAEEIDEVAGRGLPSEKNGRVAKFSTEYHEIGGEGEGVELAAAARRAYLKRFPYAAVAELELWVLRPTRMKLTDNTLGFGKKLHWERQE
ncbi:pyridoxamine 5'-phosphate oxidase family protein [Alistipes sp. OttesenSCG-928-B03]|nr:pyridoxamine 5'-phosphate oxidase family protein [Alistipes sp. OttesenSCG-928-B03]